MWFEGVKFGNPKGFTTADDVFTVSVYIFDSHERNVINGVAGGVKMVNYGKFFLLVFYVRFGIGKARVKFCCRFADVLEAASVASN